MRISLAMLCFAVGCGGRTLATDASAGDGDAACDPDPAPAGSWWRETVWEGDVWSSSLALGPDGEPVVAFPDSRDGALAIATRRRGDWQLEQLEGPFGDDIVEARVAVTAAGAIHPVAVDAASSAHHWSRGGGGWASELIASDARGQITVAAAVDAGDGVDTLLRHVFPFEFGGADLSLWRSSDGRADEVLFSMTAIDPGGLAIDAAGSARVVYGTGRPTELHYATDATGPWTETTLQIAGDDLSFAPSAIAIDSADATHVASRAAEGGVRHAILSDGAWRFDDVDPAAFAISIALGVAPDGTIQMLYVDASGGAPNGRVVHASSAGGVWRTETLSDDAIEPDRSGRCDVSLAVSATGLHALYSTPGALVYATLRSAAAGGCE